MILPQRPLLNRQYTMQPQEQPSQLEYHNQYSRPGAWISWRPESPEAENVPSQGASLALKWKSKVMRIGEAKMSS